MRWSRVDAWITLATLSLLLVAFAFPLALRAIAPQPAARAAFPSSRDMHFELLRLMASTEFGEDPWGRAWKVVPKEPSSLSFRSPLRESLRPPLVYSLGPNGRDDAGAGDDVVIPERVQVGAPRLSLALARGAQQNLLLLALLLPSIYLLGFRHGWQSGGRLRAATTSLLAACTGAGGLFLMYQPLSKPLGRFLPWTAGSDVGPSLALLLALFALSVALRPANSNASARDTDS